jgi:hypothetical protein
MVSAWIKHVKQYAKTHKMKFGEAMRAAKKTWKGGQQGGQTTVSGDVDESSVVPADMGKLDTKTMDSSSDQPVPVGTGQNLNSSSQEGSRRRR